MKAKRILVMIFIWMTAISFQLRAEDKVTIKLLENYGFIQEKDADNNILGSVKKFNNYEEASKFFLEIKLPYKGIPYRKLGGGDIVNHKAFNFRGGLFIVGESISAVIDGKTIYSYTVHFSEGENLKFQKVEPLQSKDAK